MASAAEEGDCKCVAGGRGKIGWLWAERRCSRWLREEKLRRRRLRAWLAELGALVLGGLSQQREILVIGCS
jgi:hypothetical protein